MVFKRSLVSGKQWATLFGSYLRIFSSGEFSPVNWLNKIRRNLTIEFLNFNFASRRKLCQNSKFYEKINIFAFILCGKIFIILRFGSFPFRMSVPLHSLFNIYILWDSNLDLKISTRLEIGSIG